MGEGSKKKNFSKQVGAEWSALAEEAQAPFVAEHLRLDEEHTAVQAVFEVELAEWQDQAAAGSRRRDCHFAGIPSVLLLKRLLEGERGAAV